MRPKAEYWSQQARFEEGAGVFHTLSCCSVLSITLEQRHPLSRQPWKLWEDLHGQYIRQTLVRARARRPDTVAGLCIQVSGCPEAVGQGPPTVDGCASRLSHGICQKCCCGCRRVRPAVLLCLPSRRSIVRLLPVARRSSDERSLPPSGWVGLSCRTACTSIGTRILN